MKDLEKGLVFQLLFQQSRKKNSDDKITIFLLQSPKLIERKEKKMKREIKKGQEKKKKNKNPEESKVNKED